MRLGIKHFNIGSTILVVAAFVLGIVFRANNYWFNLLVLLTLPGGLASVSFCEPIAKFELHMSLIFRARNYEGVEPSDFALMSVRFTGYVFVIISIFLAFSPIW